jgi:Holliday junction resolvasome RuvABC ATP-dependent DNA helicase subunit
VATSKPGEVILIQGPPGTGKTETITGIVAMLLQLRTEFCRVQVCAPSNCAVDEILTRVKDRGLVGITNEVKSLKKLVVRVGAPEYEPDEHIKDFTLQARCLELAAGERIEKLYKQYGQARQLYALIDK